MSSFHMYIYNELRSLHSTSEVWVAESVDLGGCTSSMICRVWSNPGSS